MRLILYFVLILLTMSFVTAVSVTRSLPSRVDPNSAVKVRLIISGATADSLFTVEEELPSGININEWSVTGAKEAKTDITTRITGNRYGWSFTPTSSSATIEYGIDVGASSVSFGSLIYFDPSGQGKVDGSTLRVAAITCGDGICEGNENSDNCESDCPRAAKPAAPKEEVKVEEPEEEVKKSNVGLLIILGIVILGLVIYLFVKKRR